MGILDTRRDTRLSLSTPSAGWLAVCSEHGAGVDAVVHQVLLQVPEAAIDLSDHSSELALLAFLKVFAEPCVQPGPGVSGPACLPLPMDDDFGALLAMR